MDLCYLDNNATTRPAPEVVAAMLPLLTEWYGNPSSVHRFGQRSRQAIDVARGQVAALLHCGESELTFTGGGTESINACLRGLLAARSPRKRIATTTVEHSATRELSNQLIREGAEIIAVPVSHDGLLDLAAMKDAISDDTALVSVMWANNETGVVFPIAEVAAICRERKVPFHCDGTQAVGKIPVDVKTTGIDCLSFASHKFHGPKGVGGYYVRRGVRVRPLILGGPQEQGRRGGTENVPGIVGMGVAAELAGAALPQITARVASLRDRLESQILTRIPGSAVNGSRDHRLPNTTNIGFPRLEAEAILLLLSEQGVCASAGAACSSGSLEPSHVLRAMEIDEKIAHGAIRFSMSRYTTDAEIDRALEVLPPIIERLNAVLPVA
jgi:cysteine desulfurase